MEQNCLRNTSKTFPKFDTLHHNAFVHHCMIKCRSGLCLGCFSPTETWDSMSRGSGNQMNYKIWRVHFSRLIHKKGGFHQHLWGPQDSSPSIFSLLHSVENVCIFEGEVFQTALAEKLVFSGCAIVHEQFSNGAFETLTASCQTLPPPTTSRRADPLPRRIQDFWRGFGALFGTCLAYCLARVWHIVWRGFGMCLARLG